MPSDYLKAVQIAGSTLAQMKKEKDSTQPCWALHKRDMKVLAEGLLAMNEELCEQREVMGGHFVHLTNQLKEAEEALRFYADKKHIVYAGDVDYEEPDGGYELYDANFIEVGQRAREYFAKNSKLGWAHVKRCTIQANRDFKMTPIRKLLSKSWELSARATKRPWTYTMQGDIACGKIIDQSENHCRVEGNFLFSLPKEDNFRFIAHAANTHDTLLKIIEELLGCVKATANENLSVREAADGINHEYVIEDAHETLAKVDELAKGVGE